MKVFITGGTGFIGKKLSERFSSDGHDVTILSRKPPENLSSQGSDRVKVIEGDPTKPGRWQEVAAQHDCFVNLAGASIFNRWTVEIKETLRRSRLWTTRNLVAAIPREEGKDCVLISASAVGYYGFHQDEILDESHPSGDDFLATLAREWEAEASKAEQKGCRVIITRFGIVLGREEGALPMMVRPFRWYLGGPLGNGRQWVSWIHIGDLVEAVLFLLQDQEASGPFNLTSPNPVQNLEFSKTIAKVLGRPSWLPAPSLAVKLLLGEFGDVILKGQRVIPNRLLEKGFQFRFPSLQAALEDLLT
jgi:hypothetical protein